MKTIILCLSLFIYAVGQNKYYVDKDASGNGSGNSWANASTKVSALPWASILAGDTVFISGGTVSKTYEKDKISNKTVTNGFVVVTKGKEAGHNGEVIFAQTSPVALETWLRYTFSINTCKGIKLSGLTFTTLVNDNESGAYILGLGNGQNNIIDSCKIISNGNGYCVYLANESKATLSNNIITVEPNNLLWGQDAINGGAGDGGHTIIGNKITMGGSVYSTQYHKDMIQFNQEGCSSNYITTIANNFFYYNSETISVSGVMYLAGVLSNIYYIYNNVIVTNVGGTAEIVIYPQNPSYDLSAHIYNNTLLTGEESSTDAFVFGDLDTLVVKNNIVVMDSISGSADLYTFIQSAPGSIAVKSIDYNHYAVQPAGIGSNFSGKSFTAWRGLGYDLNSDTGAVNFENTWGTNVEDYVTSTGKDEGTAISIFDNDILGTERFNGAAWDKGAFEIENGNPGGDITPPGLIGAVFNSSTSIELTFSEPLDPVSVVNVSNYSINNGINVVNAELSNDGIKVSLTTSVHSTGSYLVVVNNVKDTAGNIISPDNNTASYLCDLTPPNLLTAEILDSIRLELTFSEPLDSISAENTANYLITNNINIQNAYLSINLKKVNLITSPHTAGETYTITVQNVKDLAGNLIAENIKQYTYQADTTRLHLKQFSVINSKSLMISFSEKVDPVSAKNTSNYNVSRNVTISSVQIMPDSSSVLLKTTGHSRYDSYTLTLSNISDRAGNMINPNPKSILYRLPMKGNGNNVEYPVELAMGTWSQNYSPDKTIDGEGMNNPDSRWVSNKLMPDTLDFSMGESRSLDSMRVSFFDWESVIYKYSAFSSSDSINWVPIVENIWSENIEWTEFIFDSVGAKFMKLVLIESNQTTPASIWEIKTYGTEVISELSSKENLTYNLSQNYPNPFNPSTKISITLPQAANIKLAVYNILGELVRELAYGEFTAGFHEFDFEANGLASGVYIYRIESNEFIETKKMMLLQ